MKLVTFLYQDKAMPGVLSGDGRVVFSAEVLGLSADNMNEMIDELERTGLESLKRALEAADSSKGIPFSKVSLLAPIPQPKQDMICLGINYMEHAEESARYKKEAFGGERPAAIYFSKRIGEAVAPGGKIQGHFDIVERLDYEAELAVVIGKTASKVAKEEAKDYILGYTIINDVSARVLQTRHTQWYFGKSLDGFTPMGPWIVTADEFTFPPKLGISSKVNGELRQNSNTEKLIFGADHVISELSAGITLKPGTIIATGTPAGAGMGFVPPKFLKKGDKVECIIEGIGTLENVVE